MNNIPTIIYLQRFFFELLEYSAKHLRAKTSAVRLPCEYSQKNLRACILILVIASENSWANIHSLRKNAKSTNVLSLECFVLDSSYTHGCHGHM